MLERMPLVVKNIVIINVLLFLASQVIPGLYPLLSGHYFISPDFAPWQVVSHMFMHGGIAHIFFNMFGVVVFGSVLEQIWGPKRFLTYYLLSGLGAFALHMFINFLEIRSLAELIGEEGYAEVLRRGKELMDTGYVFTDRNMQNLNYAIHTGMVGASGCLFGLLIAFGVLFPNLELMLLFPPIPIKAKWFVLGYGAIEILLAIRNAEGDNVAHFAHIGGMLFGYLILKYWQSRGVRLN
ncbi:MAG: hypothetical protein RL220_1842 [Bacteroidota bacterium]|jgi:membrane associated rhomboid family serine protease